MKNAFIKTLAIAVAGLTAFTNMPMIAEAAPGTPDFYTTTSGIDSLATDRYSCYAGNNVAVPGDNVVKLLLKEHNDTASTGAHVGAFSVFTDHPEWIQVAVAGNGLNKNTSEVVNANNYPNTRMVNSGMSMTVDNKPEGATVFLIANDYGNADENKERDRTVSVSIVSRTDRDTMTFEDCTNIKIDIDAKDPEPVVLDPVPEPVVDVTSGPAVGVKPEADKPKPADPKPAAETPKPAGPAAETPKPEVEKPVETKPEVQEPEVEEPDDAREIEEANDDFQDKTNNPEDSYDVGDEIETKTATYIVTVDEGKREVEYAEAAGGKVKEVTIPKTITIDGTTYKVTSIADGAFKGNTKLKAVNIGSNVTEIGEKAFWGCKNLRTLKIASKKLTAKSIGTGAFKKMGSNITVKAPKTMLKTYRKIMTKKGLSPKASFKRI